MRKHVREIINNKIAPLKSIVTKMTCVLHMWETYDFFNYDDKIEINFIQKKYDFHVLFKKQVFLTWKVIHVIFIKYVREFFQPRLGENFVLIKNRCNILVKEACIFQSISWLSLFRLSSDADQSHSWKVESLVYNFITN